MMPVSSRHIFVKPTCRIPCMTPSTSYSLPSNILFLFLVPCTETRMVSLSDEIMLLSHYNFPLASYFPSERVKCP